MSQHHIPHGLAPFAARDVSSCYEHPTFDIVFCHPTTWKCFFLEDPLFSTLQEAQAAAAALNANGWSEDDATGFVEMESCTLLEHRVAKLVADHAALASHSRDVPQTRPESLTTAAPQASH